MTMTHTAGTTFVLRTSDAVWLQKHAAAPVGDGRFAVTVSDTEEFMFCGRMWLRHQFDSAPNDAGGQTVLACPQQWVAALTQTP